MTRCNQFHFSHFFFHFYRCTGSITPAFIPRQLCLDIYAQASLPWHLFFDFSLFLLYGHFLWTVKENAPKFLSTQKGAGAPGFSSVLHRLLFLSALQPSKTCLTDCFCPCSQKCFPWCCSCSGSSEYFQNYSCWSVSVCNRSWP